MNAKFKLWCLVAVAALGGAVSNASEWDVNSMLSIGGWKMREMDKTAIMIGDKICNKKDNQALNGTYALYNASMTDINGEEGKGTYFGLLRDGKMHGRGAFKWDNGDNYEGELECGKMHGKGQYTTADGATYSGEWENGEFTGQPKLQ
ncbi:MAG: hypothetical protein LBG13_00620 [Holosporales bacterium]|nr:hypothetical protein [Holosporales bacterium]